MSIKVTQEPENEQPVEMIATAILEISAAMKKIQASRLKRETIVALIHDKTKLNKRVIERVLDNLDQLEANFLKPVKR